MVSLESYRDEHAAAKLLCKVKDIAAKEFESLPSSYQKSLFLRDTPSLTSHDDDDESAEDSSSTTGGRSRTISVGSTDVAMNYMASPKIVPSKAISFVKSGSNKDDSSTPYSLEHHDWSCRAPSSDCGTVSLLSTSPALTIQKYGKRKREKYVGLTTKSGCIRATLRKKFSWKQFPELEDYLTRKQEEYFEFSSRNYTPEQRKYNNNLTTGLLDLAASVGYVFEDFTFSMVRDRIRCYYKSHSQSAKKKRRR